MMLLVWGGDAYSNCTCGRAWEQVGTLYLKQYRIRSGKQTIVLAVPRLPTHQQQ